MNALHLLNAPQTTLLQNLFSNLKQNAKVIVEVAIRILFIGASILIARAAFPIRFHAVILPIVAMGTALLSGFFFIDEVKIQPADFNLPPLLVPLAAGVLPEGAPRGLRRQGRNCAFNAVVQFLEGDDQMRNWRRHKALLPPEFIEFFNAYDCEEGDPNSQTLREALSQISGISQSSKIQVDASQIMTLILNFLPSDQKLHMTKECDYEGIPLKRTEKEKYKTCIALTIGENPEQQTLGQMLAKYCKDKTVLKNRNAVISRRFKSAPSALRFQIKRFNKGRKVTTAVEMPKEIAIKLVDGTHCRYRLSSFVNCDGDSIERANYTAARIVDGDLYFLNNDRVTLAGQEEWDERLPQACLLCYVPVGEPQG